MGTAFTEKENEIIKSKLKSCAMECMARYGIKKTSVDQLVEEVGISKGAFYKFYSSKELLFFEVMIDMHQLWYDKALEVLINRTDLAKKERSKLALMQVYEIMKKTAMIEIMENEMDYLMRKIPEEVLQEHCQDDETNIINLFQASGFKFSVSSNVLVASINILFMSLEHRKSIGPYFDEAFEVLIAALCEKVVIEE